MRRINLPLLIALIAGFATVSAGTVLLHHFQMGRHASFFLAHARQARDGDDPATALRNYQSYLKLQPDDVDALEELGHLQRDMGQRRQALNTFEKVLRADPHRMAVRRDVTELFIEAGRYTDAREYLVGSNNKQTSQPDSGSPEPLLDAAPRDGQLWQWLAVCQIGLGEEEQAVESLKQAVACQPTSPEPYYQLAMLLRERLDREDEADEWIERLISENGGSAAAHYACATYYHYTGNWESAAQHAQQAIQLEPDNPDNHLLAAAIAFSTNDLAAAERHAQRVLDQDATNVGATELLARVLLQSGRPTEAAELLQKALDSGPQNETMRWTLAYCYVITGETEKAEPLVAQLDRTQISPSLIAYLQARLAFSDQQWDKARALFEQAAPGLEGRPELVVDTDYRLGLCYGRLGDQPAKIKACRRSLQLAPGYVPARIELSRALWMDGQRSESLKVLRQTIELPAATPDAYALLIRYLLAPVPSGSTSEESANRAEAEQLLDAMAKRFEGAEEIPLLKSELFIVQQQIDQAYEILQAALKEHADSRRLWSSMIHLAISQQDITRAEQLLAQAADALGPCIELRVAQFRLALATQSPPETDKILKQATDRLDAFSPADRRRLFSSLVSMASQTGNIDLAVALVERWCNAEPTRLVPAIVFFDLAQRTGDDRTMDQAIDAIERAEGQGAYWHFAQAQRCSLRARLGDEEKIADAERYLAQAQRLRPRWDRLDLIAAQIADLKGDRDAALEKYLAAIDQGTASDAIIQRAVILLYEQGRYEEAFTLLERQPRTSGGLADSLAQLEMSLRLQRNDLEGAETIARRLATESNRYADYVWLGQLCATGALRARSAGDDEAAAAQQKRAVEAFQKATDLDASQLPAWISWASLLARTSQTEEALQILQQARNHLPPQLTALAFGQIYQLTGDLSKAGQFFDEAVQKGPDDLTVIRATVAFYLTVNDADKAMAQLRHALTLGDALPADMRRWARRSLAALLSTRGSYQARLEGLALMDQNLAEQSDSLADVRVRALLLASHPSPNERHQATVLLERLVNESQNPVADDRFLLAQRYLAEKRWSDFSRQMRSLLTESNDRVQYIDFYCRALIEHDEKSEAQLWLRRLEELAPNEASTLALRVELVCKQKQFDSVAGHVNRFLRDTADSSLDPQARLGSAAQVYQQAASRAAEAGDADASKRLLEQAELLCRQIMDEHDNRLPLVLLLINHGRAKEAFQLLEESDGELTWPQVVATTAAVLATSRDDPETLAKAERLVRSHMDKELRSGSALLLLAQLTDASGRYDEAEAAYRNVLEHDPQNVVAMNNLAVLMALRNRSTDEALQWINRAIELSGPVSTLLDSRATVYLAAKKPQQALRDLQAAIADNPLPTRYFHMAQAYFMMRREEEAGRAYADALKQGLEAKNLHHLERVALQNLQRSLQPSRKKST